VALRHASPGPFVPLGPVGPAGPPTAPLDRATAPLASVVPNARRMGVRAPVTTWTRARPLARGAGRTVAVLPVSPLPSAMPTYERSVRVEAPFEAVWEFHSTEEGLVALTPDWMNLRIESVRGPDGDPDPAVLDPGSVVESSVRPFGVGPRQSWVSDIVARERNAGSGFFRDTMRDGPFAAWTHTHMFYAEDGATVVRDRVEYDLPFGPLGRAVGPLGRVGLEPMFRFRHRETKRLLEG